MALFGKMGIVCRPRVEEYYGYPIRTKSGSIATITDGANNVPIRDGVFNVDYDANGYSAMRIGKSAKNLCGGDALLKNAKAYIPSGTTDTENNYFSYAAAASPASGTGGFTGSLSYKFKANTAYTFIITYSKSSGRGANMAIRYTDNTLEVLPQLPADFVQYEKYTIIFTSNASKTVDFMQKRNDSGTTRIYYNESGIFEGTLTAQDFEAWSGENHVINFPTGVTIYGGYFDSVSGVLVSTKAADGTDLEVPDIYELTPVELRTEEGETNIWCDTGDSMIRYRSYYKTDSKTITANGTYLASDDDLDGYDEVTVNVSGGQALTLHEGKISMSDGSIVADSDYYYSDFFDAPNGNVLFDLGEIDNDFGLPWYHSDGTYVDHFSSSQRFRQVNMATYYQSGDKFRLTFKKAYLNSALLVDFANIKTYCVSAIKLAE